MIRFCKWIIFASLVSGIKFKQSYSAKSDADTWSISIMVMRFLRVAIVFLVVVVVILVVGLVVSVTRGDRDKLAFYGKT